MNRRIILQRMRKNPFFVVGAVVCTLLVACLLIVPSFIRFDPQANSLTEMFRPPEWFSRGFSGHIFGTDQLGRDILARLLQGGKISLAIAFVVVVIQVVVGTVLGVLAGYYGGWVDSVIMRLCDVVLSIPNLVLALAIMAVLGTSVVNLVAVLSFSGWVQFCKLTRNNVKVARNMEYVRASQALGAGSFSIMFRQIFPNVTTHIIILASQRVGWVILLESSLSFLSLGIPAPMPSWGNMIANGREYLTLYPWIALVPGVALMITVLGFNFLGDGLRDVLDPKRTS